MFSWFIALIFLSNLEFSSSTSLSKFSPTYFNFVSFQSRKRLYNHKCLCLSICSSVCPKTKHPLSFIHYVSSFILQQFSFSTFNYQLVVSVCKSLYDNSPIIYQSDLIIKSHDNIIIMMHQSSTLLMMIDNCYQSINYSLLIATFKHYSLVLWKSAKKYHFLLLECLIYWFHNGMFFLDNFDFVCNTF